MLKVLIGEKNRFLNSGPQFFDGLLQVFYRRAAGRLAILVLGDLQFFAQDDGFLGCADADLGALLLIASTSTSISSPIRNALARAPPQN